MRTANNSLSVQGEDKFEINSPKCPIVLLTHPALPPPVVTTSSYGSTIAGSVCTLVCMVKVVDGPIAVPDGMKDMEEFFLMEPLTELCQVETAF